MEAPSVPRPRRNAGSREYTRNFYGQAGSIRAWSTSAVRRFWTKPTTPERPAQRRAAAAARRASSSRGPEKPSGPCHSSTTLLPRSFIGGEVERGVAHLARIASSATSANRLRSRRSCAAISRLEPRASRRRVDLAPPPRRKRASPNRGNHGPAAGPAGCRPAPCAGSGVSLRLRTGPRVRPRADVVAGSRRAARAETRRSDARALAKRSKASARPAGSCCTLRRYRAQPAPAVCAGECATHCFAWTPSANRAASDPRHEPP